MWFEAISSLRINLDKSELILVERWMTLRIWFLSLVVRWVGSLPFIRASHWVPHLSLWQFGMERKRGFKKDWSCERDNTSLNEGELPLFKALCLVCSFTLCPSCASQGRLDWVDLEGLFLGWWGFWVETISTTVRCFPWQKKKGLGCEASFHTQ